MSGVTPAFSFAQAAAFRAAHRIPRRARTIGRSRAWIVVESATDATAAARAATSRMIDLLVDRWGFTDVHAYLLCSVAMHLSFSQVVNEPMFTVSASIPKTVLPSKEIF